MYSGYLLLLLNGSEIYMILSLLYNVFSYDFKCLTGDEIFDYLNYVLFFLILLFETAIL